MTLGVVEVTWVQMAHRHLIRSFFLKCRLEYKMPVAICPPKKLLTPGTLGVRKKVSKKPLRLDSRWIVQTFRKKCYILFHSCLPFCLFLLNYCFDIIWRLCNLDQAWFDQSESWACKLCHFLPLSFWLDNFGIELRARIIWQLCVWNQITNVNSCKCKP